MLDRRRVDAPVPCLSSAVPAMIEGVALAFDFGTRRIGVAIGNGVTCDARVSNPSSR